MNFLKKKLFYPDFIDVTRAKTSFRLILIIWKSKLNTENTLHYYQGLEHTRNACAVHLQVNRSYRVFVLAKKILSNPTGNVYCVCPKKLLFLLMNFQLQLKVVLKHFDLDTNVILWWKKWQEVRFIVEKNSNADNERNLFINNNIHSIKCSIGSVSNTF